LYLKNNYIFSNPIYLVNKELQKRCPWLGVNEKSGEISSAQSTTTQEQQQTTAA